MRYALALLMLLHGLIHLLGFAKAYGARSLPLETPISKGLGLAWLGATLLMSVAAALLFHATSTWWLPAAVGVLLSQALVLGAFRDAKFGTLPNLIIALAIAAGLLGHHLPGVGSNRYLGAGGEDSATLPACAMVHEYRQFSKARGIRQASKSAARLPAAHSPDSPAFTLRLAAN